MQFPVIRDSEAVGLRVEVEDKVADSGREFREGDRPFLIGNKNVVAVVVVVFGERDDGDLRRRS